MINYRLVAIQVGDLVKFSITVNEVSRIATALFRFPCDSFPHEAITSQRAALIYDWIMSLAGQEMESDKRHELLIQFCRNITPEEKHIELEKILKSAGFTAMYWHKDAYNLFSSRNFHPEVVRHSRDLFLKGNNFHAVFEACKAYNSVYLILGIKFKFG